MLPGGRLKKTIAVLSLIVVGCVVYLFYQGVTSDQVSRGSQIISFMPWGNGEGSIGLGKKRSGETFGPTSLFVSHTNVIYVPDPVNARVLVIDSEGAKPTSLTFKQLDRVIRPIAVASRPSGDLFILDADSRRLFKGTADAPMTLVEAPLPDGFADGDIYRVEDLRLARNGDLYLMDEVWMSMCIKRRLVVVPVKGQPRILFAQTLQRSGAVEEEPTRAQPGLLGRMEGFAASYREGAFLQFGSLESESCLVAYVDENGRVISTTEVGTCEESKQANRSGAIGTSLVGADQYDNFYIGRNLGGSSPSLEKYSRSGKMVSITALTDGLSPEIPMGLSIGVAIHPGGTAYALVPQRDGVKIVKMGAKFRQFSSAQ